MRRRSSYRPSVEPSIPVFMNYASYIMISVCEVLIEVLLITIPLYIIIIQGKKKCICFACLVLPVSALSSQQSSSVRGEPSRRDECHMYSSSSSAQRPLYQQN